jgi:hypothetical protein
MAPAVLATPRSPAHRIGGPMDSMKSSVFRPVDREDTHPHACWHGLVFLTYTVFDEEAGEEVEHIEALPCRRCAEEACYQTVT